MKRGLVCACPYWNLEDLEYWKIHVGFSSPRPVATPLATCISSSAALRQKSLHVKCSSKCGSRNSG